MADNRSKSREAATLLRRAASILTRDLSSNATESEGCSSQSVTESEGCLLESVRPNPNQHTIQPPTRQQATTSSQVSHEEFWCLFATNNTS